MAVTTAMNVIRMTANGDTVAGRSLCIEGIKVVETAGAVAHIRLRQTDVTGTVVYESKVAAAGIDWCDAYLKGAETLYLEVVSGAVNVYLYSE